MPVYTHYYTQNKIKEIPEGLIKDIIQLFKNIYGPTIFKEMNKLDTKKISSFDEVYDDIIYIVRLNNKNIYIRIYCDWFIIDVDKFGKLDCDPDDDKYEFIVKLLIMLCIYYGVIENGFEDDNNKYDDKVIQKCKKELYKLGFKNFKCNYENNHYFINMIKKNKDVLLKSN